MFSQIFEFKSYYKRNNSEQNGILIYDGVWLLCAAVPAETYTHTKVNLCNSDFCSCYF